jgi:MoaA/NifB/PqqE/SkfB family radical SAM enzyme
MNFFPLKVIGGYAKLLAEVDQIPLIISLNITDLCNARCGFCDIWKRKQKNNLPFEDVKRIIIEGRKIGGCFFNFTGGEPLLRKDLLEMLKFAKKLKVYTSIITNGFLLKHKMDEIGKYVDGIMISLDFPDERQDRFRRIPGLFKNVMEGIEKSKHYTKNICLLCTIMSENIDDLKKLVDLAERLEIKVSFQTLMYIENTRYKKLEIKDIEKYEKVIDELISLKKKGKPIVNSLPYLKAIKDFKPFKCKTGWSSFEIGPKGNFYIFCPKNPVNVKIKNRSLKEIWYSEEMKKFRMTTIKCKPLKGKCYGAGCILEQSILLTKPQNVFERAYYDLRYAPYLLKSKK